MMFLLYNIPIPITAFCSAAIPSRTKSSVTLNVIIPSSKSFIEIFRHCSFLVFYIFIKPICTRIWLYLLVHLSFIRVQIRRFLWKIEIIVNHLICFLIYSCTIRLIWNEALSHISISLFHLIFMTYFLRFSRWSMVLLEFITS